MEFRHLPVLCGEVIDGLNIREDGIYLDGTLGGGGHSFEICRRLSPEGILIGIDRDEDALCAAEEKLQDFLCARHLIHSDFENVKSVLAALGIGSLDGVLLDLGVSSFQLDNPERGFSYMRDAPLDMRMDAGSGMSAEDVVNSYSEDELARIIKDYGEERWAVRISRFIAEARKNGRIKSTGELTEIIKAAIPAKARREGPHPAKRTFQAIRIEVNDELGQLKRSLNDFIDLLAPGGRIAVISFHSLEDRIVKEAFQKRLNPCTCPPEFPVCVCGKVPDVKKITRKPITASPEELKANPRSRSAKLRILEKIQKGS